MGFGGGMLSVPMLGLFMPVADAVTLSMVFQLMMAVMFFTIRTNINWAQLKELLPGIFIGPVIGILLLSRVNEDLMRVLLALYIFWYVAKDHVKILQVKNLPPINGYVMGFLAGIIQGMIGMGAPLFSMYLKSRSTRFAEFRANIIALLFLSNVTRLPVSMAEGVLDREVGIQVLFILPFFLLALWAGHSLHTRVTDKRAALYINILLVLCGLLLIAKALLDFSYIDF